MISLRFSSGILPPRGVSILVPTPLSQDLDPG
jgi:hypothetical protein